MMLRTRRQAGQTRLMQKSLTHPGVGASRARLGKYILLHYGFPQIPYFMQTLFVLFTRNTEFTNVQFAMTTLHIM